jgi:16S rRNA (guanine527-N7)-methyltransferase
MTLGEKHLLISLAKEQGIALDDLQAGGLLRYADLLREWNGKINLISRQDIANVISNHIADSLIALPVLRSVLEQQPGGTPVSVMDLGPGGGLPGIPLKICLSEIAVTFVEATQKKARFIELAAKELRLDTVTVIARHSRDLLTDKNHLEAYDCVTARAVAELKELVKDSFPFLKPGGRLIAYKSIKAGEEIAASQRILKRFGGVIEPGSTAIRADNGKQRRIVVVRKQD